VPQSEVAWCQQAMQVAPEHAEERQADPTRGSDDRRELKVQIELPNQVDAKDSPREDDTSRSSSKQLSRPGSKGLRSSELKAQAEAQSPTPCLARRTTGLFSFANVDAIKEKVRAAKTKPPAYDVTTFYYEEGFFQWVAKHSRFENTTLTIIVINAFWISVDTDLNKADTLLTADPVFVAADSMFFIYFSLELFIRFAAFKKKCDCLRDGWFKFDGTLVFLYAFDPFTIALVAKAQGGGGLDLPTAVLRLFRLARLSRLVRMLRSLPELMVMIKGMIQATSTVGYTLGLLMIITYVFSIALRNLVPKDPCIGECENGTIEEVYFSSVPEAMHNLIIFGTFLDALSDIIADVKEASPVCLVLFWIYIALASLTVMNMLIGVLCEVISAVAVEENESMQVDAIFDKFGAIVSDLDQDSDGTLSWEEFKVILDVPDTMKALEQVNVDPESMVDMAEDFFFEDGVPVTVPLDDFLGMVLDLRGGQQATVKHMMQLGKRYAGKFGNMAKKMDRVQSRIDKTDRTLDSIIKNLKKGKGQMSKGNPKESRTEAPEDGGRARGDQAAENSHASDGNDANTCTDSTEFGGALDWWTIHARTP
jgi:voltage-gated sodium channel